MRKTILSLILVLSGLSVFAQVDVKSPTATEFVKYQRIPVSYFNGLPSINIPLYTAQIKDLELPLSLNYYASGVKVNQYPTYVGLGWNLNAGGCITRVINGRADETINQDQKDITGIGMSGGDLDPGYYYSSCYLDQDNWASEQRLIDYINAETFVTYDWEPDEFIVNAYGINGSFYFYRDRDKKMHVRIKSCNGEKFTVSTPIIKNDPEPIKFHSLHAEKDLQSYRIYRLFYEFTITKQDGTKLIFGGDNDCIEFATEKRMQAYNSSELHPFFKTLPTSWMLREVISPKGNKISFSYQRNGNPIILNDVINDLWVYSYNGGQGFYPSQDKERGKSFQVLHPVYPKSIVFDDDLKIEFSISRNEDLSTVRTDDLHFLKYDGFSDHFADGVCYEENGGSKIPYAPHNYFCHLNSITISHHTELLSAYVFTYTRNKAERLKLQSFEHRSALFEPELYQFTYNPLCLPDYNATETDNWGFYNGKNYRDISIEDGLYEYRTANDFFAQAEILTSISYPAGGKADFTYESNDYSQIATQVPDFKLEKKSGQAGGLRIKQLTYTDPHSHSELVHYFEYVNEDGTSSGILSGIPRYITDGHNHASYNYSYWDGLVHFRLKGDIDQRYIMLSERYINVLGSTNGNHVTYSRVVEKIGKEQPLKKVYYYSNHDTYPDVADYQMYTNIDEVDLDNKFTSKALMRGLLMKEVWYNGDTKVKEIVNRYKEQAADTNDFMRCIDRFKIPGVYGYTISVPFVRFTPYKIWTYYPFLEERAETLYDSSGKTVIQAKHEQFTYNEDLLMTVHESQDSKGKTVRHTYTYPGDVASGVNVYSKMVNKGMKGLPVEQLEYRDGKLCAGELTVYNEFNTGLLLPQKNMKLGLTEPIEASSFSPYNGIEYDSRYQPEYEILQTDRYGNPTAISGADGVVTSYQWGSNYRYPVIQIRNSQNSYKATTVYEPVRKTEYVKLSAQNSYPNEKTYTIRTSRAGTVEINLSGMIGYDWYVSGRFDGKPFSLVQCRSDYSDDLPWRDYKNAYTYRVEFASVAEGEHTIQITSTLCDDINADLPGELNYSYWGSKSHVETTGHDEWLYEDFEGYSGEESLPFGFYSSGSHLGTYEIRLSGAYNQPLFVDYQVYKNGKWNYVRKEMNDRNFIIDEGMNPIDEVRVYPQHAQVTSYGYLPFVGMNRMTDGRGLTESYAYDEFQRLRSISDYEGNIRKTYDYHYQNQSEEEDYRPPYYSEAISRTFYSSLCDSTKGQHPAAIVYEVPAGKYSSSVSQEEANRMAVDDLLQNGQRYADENGECVNDILVSVINPLDKTCIVDYFWGIQGNLQHTYYAIPPSERIGETGDPQKDYKPTVISVARKYYRDITMYLQEDNSIRVDFDMLSDPEDYHFNVNYTEEGYPDFRDTYIIKPLNN